MVLGFVAALVGLAQTAPTLPKDHDGMLRLKATAPNSPAERPRKQVQPPATPARVLNQDGALDLTAPGVPINKESNLAPGSLAPFPALEGKAILSGFDPVAWLVLKRAKAGSSDITTVHAGQTIRFANQESREAFLKEPGRYLPEYGGYCAYSMARGEALEGQPMAFRLLAGRVYLFATEAFAVSWERDQANLVPAADQAWRTARLTQ
ncbi:MAG: hypothetical protein NTV70_13365 [Acidobacteria bacterium]|nr:hypothetical protein [Acidobacteriota bacterium]